MAIYADFILAANTEGQDPQLDHGIASGLLLLQYTSIWYWLWHKAMTECRDFAEEFTKNFTFNYTKRIFKEYLIPACMAVVYHNVPDLRFITLKDEPLVYLAVLCDELQIWDRFPSGTATVKNWQEYRQIMAEDIEVSILNGYESDKVRVSASPYVSEKVLRNLSRLNDWERVVDVQQTN